MDKIGPIIYHSPSLIRIILNLFNKMATPIHFVQEGYCVPATYTLFSDGTKIVARDTGPI